jgi:hypothetical protein
VATLRDLLRKALTDQAKTGRATTYRELADRLGLKPPQIIHQLTQALEALMEEDAAAGRPLLSALCTSKLRPGLPAPGFFIKANVLGIFSGEVESAAALDFYESERRRALSFYGSLPDSSWMMR